VVAASSITSRAPGIIFSAVWDRRLPYLWFRRRSAPASSTAASLAGSNGLPFRHRSAQPAPSSRWHRLGESPIRSSPRTFNRRWIGGAVSLRDRVAIRFCPPGPSSYAIPPSTLARKSAWDATALARSRASRPSSSPSESGALNSRCPSGASPSAPMLA